MENQEKEIKNYYLKEFSYFDGEKDITFNILDINTDKMTITLAVTNLGKIYVIEQDLLKDKEQKLYFEFGVDFTKIQLDDFEKIED